MKMTTSPIINSVSSEDKYSFNVDTYKLNLKFISHIVISIITFFILLFPLGYRLPVGLSFINAVIAALITIFFLTRYNFKEWFGKKVLFILVFSFSLRLIIGLIHFLVFIQPDYFSNPENFHYLWDYDYNYSQMLIVSNTWHLHGIFSPLPEIFYSHNKNVFIQQFMGLIFYFSGDYVLNIAVWNSLMNIYTSAIIGFITYLNTKSQKMSLISLTVIAFQPWGIISSIVWRDTTGMFLVAVAVFLIIGFKDNLIFAILFLPIAAFLASWQRSPYLFVIIFLFFYIFWNEKRLTNILLILFLLTFVFVIYNNKNNLLLQILDIGTFRGTYQGDGYLDLLSTPILYQIPIRILKAITGPFPWLQFFQKPLGYEYQPMEYLTSVFNLSIYIMVIPYVIRKLKKSKKLDYCFFMGIMLIFLGLLAWDVHSAYISIGIPFLIPEFSRIYKRNKFIKSIFISFTLFILLHLVFGISSLRGKHTFGL